MWSFLRKKYIIVKLFSIKSILVEKKVVKVTKNEKKKKTGI